MKRFSLSVSLLIAAAVSTLAQSPTPTKEMRELFETIAHMDAKTFDAFNTHDIPTLMTMFAEDVEFYHDAGGLTNFEQTKKGFTKMFGNSPDIRRDLVAGSLEVYPIKDYGAIEIGSHRFCHKENGKDDCGTFKFAMIWRKTGDTWKIARVLSYAHEIRP
jgi:ketosteroid isomerase-like protein